MGSKNFTYEKSGVSIKKADKFIKFISSSTKKSKKSGHFENIGGFGALTKLRFVRLGFVPRTVLLEVWARTSAGIP